MSFCFITEGQEPALLNVLVPMYKNALEKVGGDLVLAGDLRGLKQPEGAVCLHLPEEAHSHRLGKLRNAAISRSRGKLILTGNTCVMFDPENWADLLVDWVESINECVPCLFGLRVLSSSGERLWDWVKVESGNRVTLEDYGEQSSNLAIGGGCLGMSRAAWEVSGGFNEDFKGPGEDIEFSHRQSKNKRTAIVFCDAFQVVSLSTGRNLSSPQGP